MVLWVEMWLSALGLAYTRKRKARALDDMRNVMKRHNRLIEVKA